MAFMPHHAPLVFLGLLGTCFLLGLVGLGFLGSLVFGRRGLAGKLLVAGAAVAGTYAVTLLACSLASRETVLRPGEQKYFCEVDCHEAYSVAGVTTAQALGAPANQPRAPANQTPAQGTFYLVSVKVWFDESTISPRRGNGYLHPNPHVATVIDDSGRRYAVSPEGQAAFERLHGPAVPFTEPLRPGDSYVTTLVFDLPTTARKLRLFITTEPSFTRFLIGHENSCLHKKVLFEISPQGEKASM